jgi:hypothetical protein
MRPSGRLANLRSVCALAAVLSAPGLVYGQPVGQQYTATWVQSNPGGVAPSARGMVATAYDQANDRLIVSGGNSDGALHNDVWVLRNASQQGSAAVWEQLQPSGQAPPIRETHVAAYDPATNRLVIHGGWPGLSDAWVLTNANGLGGTPEWLPLPAAPVVRASAASAYDAVHHRLIVFGGADVNYYTTNAWLNDVWVLIDADGVGSPTWEQLHPTGTPPTPRAGAAVAYDSTSNRMIVFGGSDVNASLNDLWILTNANGMGGEPEWIPVSTASSPSERSTSMGYDAGAKRAFIVGGWAADSPPLSNEVWVLDNADGTTGAPRWAMASPLGAAYDGNLTPVVYTPSTGRLVVALGVLGNGSGYRNDVWLCDVGAAGGQTEVQVHVPPDVVTEATGPAGAAVSFAASATDGVGAVVPVSCTPSSGSLFAVGTTMVTCTAVDGVASGTFGVTVQDTTPPALVLPSAIAVTGTSSAGAVVAYQVSATDLVSGGVAVHCTPQTGQVFPLGTTVVNCSATDAAGNVASGSFAVTVREGVTVQLIDSRGIPISGGVVQYYSGSWLPFGTTGSDGRVSLALPMRSYTFRMTYAGGVKDIAQNTAANSVVTYRTTNVNVQLKDSSGLPLDAGTVQYYAGSWRAFGTTAGGQVSLELLPVSYTFRMLYAGGTQDKTQNTSTGAPVIFQTVTATVRLASSVGAPLDGGQVQYYAGSWRPFGVTAGGQASLELLPVAYTFRVTLAGGVQDKAQTVASGTVVGFATAPVHSDSGTCTGYYAGAWRLFLQDMELLPATYVFRFTGSPDTSYSVTAGLTNSIR